MVIYGRVVLLVVALSSWMGCGEIEQPTTTETSNSPLASSEHEGPSGGLEDWISLNQGEWCEVTQRLLVRSPQGTDLLEINHLQSQRRRDFAWAKPRLTGGPTNGVVIQTVAFPAFPTEQPSWTPFAPVSADSLACKMKSEEAILAALGEDANEPPLQCGDLNRAAWNRGWDRLDDEAQQRLADAGVRIEILPDLDFSSGIGWIRTQLAVDVPGESSWTYRVQSPRLVTARDAPLGLGGNHYCKLLTPTRALEWLFAKDKELETNALDAVSGDAGTPATP